MKDKQILIWEEKYSVGVKTLDEQHKIIFNLINKLARTKNITVWSEILTVSLTEAIEYFLYHLKVEEKYMEDYGYPEYEEHIKEHIDFKKKVSYFNLGQIKHLESVPDEFLSFLIEWWKNHILKSDMRYKPFFQKMGLK